MRVCAVTEDPIFDNCQYVPGISDGAPVSTAAPPSLCPPGDVSCLMTGKDASQRLRKDRNSALYRDPILDNPIVWVGLAVALVILLKR